jgi:hypothetical protein
VERGADRRGAGQAESDGGGIAESRWPPHPRLGRRGDGGGTTGKTCGNCGNRFAQVSARLGTRRLERSRPKGGAVERPSLDDKQLIVDRRSLRSALRAPVETTEKHADSPVRVRQIYATTLRRPVKRKGASANTCAPEGGRQTRRKHQRRCIARPRCQQSAVTSSWASPDYECPSLHSLACELPISRSMTTLWLSTLRKGFAPE